MSETGTATAKEPGQEGSEAGAPASRLSPSPQWFIVLVAFAYAVGFLIVSTFLDSFGVQDATREFLRLKYLQVGFYFLMFFGSLIAVPISLLRAILYHRVKQQRLEQSARQQRLEQNTTRTANISSGGLSAVQVQQSAPPVSLLVIPLWIVFLVPIYLAIGFAEPQLVGRRGLPYAAVLVFLSFAGSICIYGLAKRFGPPRNRDFPKVYTTLFLILVLMLVWPGWRIVAPFAPKLLDLLRHRGYLILGNLILFLVTLGWMSYRAVVPRSEFDEQEHHIYMWARLSIGLPIFYMAVLTFAYGIYPFMSVSKGGGYYPESEFVKLVLRRPVTLLRQNSGEGPSQSLELIEHSPDALPAELREHDLESKPLVLIEETTTSVYVADPSDPIVPPNSAAGPGGVKCWTNFSCRPRVFEIQKINLQRIEHIPVAEHTD